MNEKILLLPIIIPFAAGILSLVCLKKLRIVSGLIAFLATLINFFLTVILFKANFNLNLPWAGQGLEFSLRIYHFSAFTTLATAFFGFLIIIYSLVFMRGKQYLNQFYAYFLLSLAFANGAVLADNLILMLFFWEGLLLSLFGLIAIGNKNAFKTATKAFIIVGVCDLCLLVGIALTGHLAGTLVISKINLSLSPLAIIAFILMMIGAISKAGAMPFHSWIPDAACDAPLPFMALFPASLEKLIGIYLLARISLDMFQLTPASSMSMVLMVIGAITIVLAVMMALIQKDYKRLLSYHAISQVGYMILGIGTALPVGIIGGLFHMINNALYKSCLFLTGGAVEKQTGSSDLNKLGGIAQKMPLTFVCFFITALSISGVPPFNGFFSKELIYDGALERGWIFYLAALAGSFFTAASFLKLGHAAFLGKISEQNKNTKEVPLSMLIPMVLIAVTCIIFGVFNSLPINHLILPILSGKGIEGHKFCGWPSNIILVTLTVIVLLAAFLNHLYGVKQKGSGLHALDHIRYAPFLSGIYNLAEKGVFDPYNLAMKISAVAGKIIFWCDRKIDWLYDSLTVNLTLAISRRMRQAHTGSYSRYLFWSLTGIVLVVGFLFIKMYR